MKNTWIPQINETVSWGCDIGKVISLNFGGRLTIKVKSKYIRNIDISEVEKIG